jgi:hypothetical protein
MKVLSLPAIIGLPSKIDIASPMEGGSISPVANHLLSSQEVVLQLDFVSTRLGSFSFADNDTDLTLLAAISVSIPSHLITSDRLTTGHGGLQRQSACAVLC